MNPDRPSTPPPPVREVDVEVLPAVRAGRSATGAQDPLAALIARVMDSLFTVPGTGIKVGLDPLLGLLPMVGAPASALISLVMLIRSAQAGVPIPILARMALNVLLNAILDEVPVVGDFISIFFRSNQLNYDLMQKHAGARRAYTAGDKAQAAAIVLGAILFVVSALVGFAFLAVSAFHWLFGGRG